MESSKVKCPTFSAFRTNVARAVGLYIKLDLPRSADRKAAQAAHAEALKELEFTALTFRVGAYSFRATPRSVGGEGLTLDVLTSEGNWETRYLQLFNGLNECEISAHVAHVVAGVCSTPAALAKLASVLNAFSTR